jgi:hypothetical protein
LLILFARTNTQYNTASPTSAATRPMKSIVAHFELTDIGQASAFSA